MGRKGLTPEHPILWVRLYLTLTCLIPIIAASALACNIKTLDVDEETIIQQIEAKQYDEALASLDGMEEFSPYVNMRWVEGERAYIYLQLEQFENVT